MIDASRDALLGGRVSYRQPKRGYRVGLEAPLLAAFATPEGRRPPRRVVDLGAGPGAIGLCVASRAPSAHVTFVEIDEVHAGLCAENVRDNGLLARAEVVTADVARVVAKLGRGGFDLVVSNPPWFDGTRGQSPSDARRARARMLDGAVLRAFVVAAKELCGRGGRACLTFPSASLEWLMSELGRVKLVPKRLRFVHARADAPANALFVECVSGKPGGLIVEPPLFVRVGDGYGDEARATLWPT